MAFPAVALADLYEGYDYIIIGGGTAGCVLANRLSQDPNITVLVLERGSSNDGWKSRIPLFSAHWASDGSASRTWPSLPQEHLNGREIQLVGGNVLGGTSKVNAMLYMRGLPAEMNLWAEIVGSEDWRSENMQKYFVRSEKNLDENLVGKKYHGSSGEWPNRSLPTLWEERMAHLVKATSALGFPYVEDLNSPDQPAHGFSKLRFNVDSAGNRASAASCFLPKELVKLRARRLHICVQAAVHRIQIEGEGERAEGVWVQKSDGSGPTRFIKAKRELILCGGTMSSPQTLMLSGIGPKEHLKEHGIPVKKDLPGVGSHLQDHLMVPIQFQVPFRDSTTRLQASIWLLIKELVLYFLFGIGILANASTMDAVLFVQTRLLDDDKNSDRVSVSSYAKEDMDASLPRNLPDLEILPIGTADMSMLKAAGAKNGGLSLYAVSLRPESKGTVRLVSSDPLAPAQMDPKSLSKEYDLAILRTGIRFNLHLADQLKHQGYPISALHVPKSTSDADLDEFIKKECVSGNHWTSSCRMAPEAEGGVVDARLRVYGVKGLRVVDASVMPESPSMHLAALTVAIAEKCADMVLEDARKL